MELITHHLNLFLFIKLHAVTQKIQLPRSPVEQLNKEQDFAHVLDFLANIESLEIVGNRDFYRNSNLILNNLPFDLSAFKSLKHLCFNGANVSSLMCARSLRTSLETLSAHSCGLKTMIEILVCDSVHKNLEVKVRFYSLVVSFFFKKSHYSYQHFCLIG